MGAESTSAAHRTKGHEKCPAAGEDLLVTTGLFGDSLRVVDPSSPLFGRVSYALREQGGWTAQTHAAFWTALLPDLPRRGRPIRTDAVSLAVAALVDDGLTHEEACAVVSVEPGTVRQKESDSRRARPSRARGLRLLTERRGVHEAAAVAQESDWSPLDSLPRVWTDADPEPTGDLNPHLEVEWWSPPGIETGQAAAAELRRRWHERVDTAPQPVFRLAEDNGSGNGDEIALTSDQVDAFRSGQPVWYLPRDRQLTIGGGGAALVRRESAVPPSP